MSKKKSKGKKNPTETLRREFSPFLETAGIVAGGLAVKAIHQNLPSIPILNILPIPQSGPAAHVAKAALGYGLGWGVGKIGEYAKIEMLKKVKRPLQHGGFAAGAFDFGNESVLPYLRWSGAAPVVGELPAGFPGNQRFFPSSEDKAQDQPDTIVDQNGNVRGVTNTSGAGEAYMIEDRSRAAGIGAVPWGVPVYSR